MTVCPECDIAREERAAILEYDAGMLRRDAEKRARNARCEAHRVTEQKKLFGEERVA